ncbi:Kelch-like protein 20 [Hypsibius exemplaris]|uniref:Kelch-like protein 20 n=1 Tax=Hypsibius exemplaris TaxID=2072580 RepID=A0A1W0WY17_HYPEX|nr:Kelch-like protein 20 [Hypsibius exemplaris]
MSEHALQLADAVQLRRLSVSGLRRKSVGGQIDTGTFSTSDVDVVCDGGGTGSDYYPELCSQFEELNRLWQAEDPCDVTLKAGIVEIDAHRKVLSAYSPYFRAMFASGLSESLQDEVELQHIDGSALEAVIIFAYTGRLTLNQDNVQQLLEVSSLLYLDNITRECCRFLVNALDPVNSLGIARFADTYCCPYLLEIAERFTRLHFSEVAAGEEFLETSAPSLLKLLSSDSLFATDEEEIFKIATAWIVHDPTERTRHLPAIKETLQLPPDLCRPNSAVIAINPLEERSRPFHCNGSSRRHYLRDTLLISGGLTPQGDRLNIMETYNAATDRWLQLDVPTLPGQKSGHCSAVLNGFLYVSGGTDGKLNFSSVHRFDPLAKVWSQGTASMSSSRTYHGMVAVNGFLYALGGVNNDCDCLSSVERYDPVRNTWHTAPSMLSKRCGLGVAAVNGVIYVCGGSDGTFKLNTVERLDLRYQKWEMLSPMVLPRFGLGCCCLNGFLYAIGGNKQDPASCERMDLKTHVWEQVPPMSSPRPHGSVHATERHGRLYVVGGSDRNENVTLEAFEPDRQTWHPRTALSSPNRIDASVAVLRL